MSDIKKSENMSGGLVTSGDALVADFQSAIANLVTMETAQYAAELSERAAIQTIQTADRGSNGLYVTPRDIPDAAQQLLLHSSVDAHIKKVQAQQIASYTAGQIAELEATDIKTYLGKKIQVDVIDQEIGAVESYWHDDKTGKESRGVIKAKTVKGIIEELSFSKNLLVIKPLLASRLILSARKFFLVSVINPTTLSPLVSIKLI